MGNCVGSCFHGETERAEIIKVIREEDAKVLVYRPPIMVKDILLQHPNCEVMVHDMEPQKEPTKPLDSDHMMSPNVVYHLVQKEEEEEKSKFSPKRLGGEKGVLKVKIVLTKQELAQLLSKCGEKGGSVEDILEEIKRLSIGKETASYVTQSNEMWRPTLDSIPEELPL
ncbi:hypothetical protein AMTRI_Chr01g111780 [Amborella trichopoda]|uniref:Uncharacterized protein n=1 Tax=Amborella trichopoda TaxID=13333 RepID=W1Q0P2_AMBTC|nr:uncharacterized protein LOC18442402 [Amborella trichopoda]ERN14149.1 hypothetical protein AMTR_s00021p00251140 [Amborella trichopoda]|eukprot:XP_006852682.1 uncharacterized protein LOC18442402 [Amborella trichopoda]